MSPRLLIMIVVCCSTGAPALGQNLFFGSNPVPSGTPGNLLLTSDLDGFGLSDIMPAPPMPISGVAADGRNSRVFWTELTTGGTQLHTSDLTGGSHSVIWSGPPLYKRSVSLDPVGQRVYWTASGAILSSDYAGAGLTTVVPASHPMEIEVDAAAGRVFWTDVDPAGRSIIRRANLNGTGVVTLQTAHNGEFFSGITLNKTTHEVYWSEFQTGEVRSLPYAGGPIPSVLLSGLPSLAGLDYERTTGRLYMVNVNAASVSWMLPTGGPLTTVFAGSGTTLGEMWDVSAIVPVPGTLSFLGLGGLLVARRRR